jgi:hypothetical protein
MRVNLNQADWSATECHEGCRYSINKEPSDCFDIISGPAAKIGRNCVYDAKPSGQVCSADDPPKQPEKPDDPPSKCPAGQKRLPDGKCANKGECPTGQHMAAGKCTPDGECKAGQVKGPDGSCVDESCPAGQAKAKDGTCKPDGDGDGEPNEGEDTGKFSGGDDCKTPPQCSGDNILCGQARIQWRIDCNTRRNRTLTGGIGCGMGDVPICTGEKCDALEYSQLLQAWKARCAVERLGTGTPTTGDPATAQIRDFLTGGGVPSAPDPWISEDLQPAQWSSGLGQGSCPAPIELSVNILGRSAPVTLSFQPICDFAGILRTLLLACSAILSLSIIAGARK